VIDVEKFYKVARNYVGELNKDRVHHTFEKVHDRIPKVNPEGYFYRAMKNELRGDSKFRKQYDRCRPLTQEEEFDNLHDIDPVRVESILKQLSNEGHRLEVKAFIEMSVATTARQLKEKTGIRYNNLLKIRNFVRTEVIKRYGNID
jgi:hypothetical protein